MNTCAKCGEKIEDGFDSCWKCSTPVDETRINKIRSAILAYLELVSGNPPGDWKQIMKSLAERGLDPAICWHVMGLVPVYAGRLLIGDMGPYFSNEFVVVDQAGETVASGNLPDNDIYREILAHDAAIRTHAEFQQLALSSSEVRAINDLLNKGSKPSDIMLSPVLLTEYT